MADSTMKIFNWIMCLVGVVAGRSLSRSLRHVRHAEAEVPIGPKPEDSHRPWPAGWDPAWDGPSTRGEVQTQDEYHKDYPKDSNPGATAPKQQTAPKPQEKPKPQTAPKPKVVAKKTAETTDKADAKTAKTVAQPK